MKQCMDAENLHRRLKKIIGQVQAIDRMVDEDVPCEDVLSQINAAKSALHGCGKVVLEGHIRHCVRDGIEHGDADKTIDSFTKAVFIFAISIPITYNVGNLIIFTQTKRKSEIPHELYSNGSGVEPEQRWLGGGLQGTSL